MKVAVVLSVALMLTVVSVAFAQWLNDSADTKSKFSDRAAGQITDRQARGVIDAIEAKRFHPDGGTAG
ncbi:hypothetical protein [Pseudarthrobacter sulfonivorans]|uniref:hypothetical protein n=1 Tax=Pseudarthrobacter sulfonivorans TaxID=121292 RepID=UPI00278074F5|nr:hypothetical protein [Pseudarthrobacter sulfonivorans]MDP9998411.1 putative membrane protein [Pseudarthrobacter sulfonivorans]